MNKNSLFLTIIFILSLGMLIFSVVYFQPRVIEKEIITEVPKLYKVARVVDGDTINVEIDGQNEAVRLIGIDTPEVNSPYTQEECYGPESSAYLKEFLTGQYIYLLPDPANDNRDIYDRLLRYAFLENGTFVQAELLKNGYAYNYMYSPFEFVKQFDYWEKEAKKEKRGLWKECQ